MHGKSGFTELLINKLIQIIGTAQLKKKQLLGNQPPILCKGVKFRPVPMQGTVRFFEYCCQSKHFADKQIFCCIPAEFLYGRLKSMDKIRIIQPIGPAGVNDHIKGNSTAHLPVDLLGIHPDF